MTSRGLPGHDVKDGWRSIILPFLWPVIAVAAVGWGLGWCARPPAPFVLSSNMDEKLVEAAQRGDAAAVRHCLGRGASIGCHSNGWTPLMCAAASGDVDCVRAILEAGSDPSASGSGGTTALIAAQRCADPEPVIRLLIAAGADVDAGNTWDGDRPLIAATIKGQLRIVALLLEAGANPAAKDEDGQTARERALECGQEDIAALLANWEMARRG